MRRRVQRCGPDGQGGSPACAASLWTAQADRRRQRRQYCINVRSGNIFGFTCVCASLCSGLLFVLPVAPLSAFACPTVHRSQAEATVQEPLCNFFKPMTQCGGQLYIPLAVLLHASFSLDLLSSCRRSGGRKQQQHSSSCLLPTPPRTDTRRPTAGHATRHASAPHSSCPFHDAPSSSVPLSRPHSRQLQAVSRKKQFLHLLKTSKEI
jgi:hypothetical protein